MDSTLQNKASGSQYTVPNKFQLLAPSVSMRETDGFIKRNQRYLGMRLTVFAFGTKSLIARVMTYTKLLWQKRI